MAGLVKLAQFATKYADELTKVASKAQPVNLTLGTDAAKTASTLLAGGKFDAQIKLFQELGADAFEIAVKNSKLHKGGKMMGLAVKNNAGDTIYKAAALIDPSVGKTPAVNVKARGFGGLFNGFFDPNKAKVSDWDDMAVSLAKKDGQGTLSAHVGDMFKIKAQGKEKEALQLYDKLLQKNLGTEPNLVQEFVTGAKKMVTNTFRKLFGAPVPESSKATKALAALQSKIDGEFLKSAFSSEKVVDKLKLNKSILGKLNKFQPDKAKIQEALKSLQGISDEKVIIKSAANIDDLVAGKMKY